MTLCGGLAHDDNGSLTYKNWEYFSGVIEEYTLLNAIEGTVHRSFCVKFQCVKKADWNDQEKWWWLRCILDCRSINEYRIPPTF